MKPPLLLLAVLLLTACEDPGNHGWPEYRLVLRGLVTDSSGMPVDSARLHTISCAAPVVHPERATTGPDGRYTMALIRYVPPPEPECVRLVVHRNWAAVLRADTAVLDGVRFRSGRRPPPDTIDVHFVLPRG